MPTIKQMLDALMKTRTTKSEASASAMPSYNKISVPLKKTEVNDWETVAEYVAPTDGYAQLVGTSTNDGAVMTAIVNDNLRVLTTYPWNNYEGGGYIQVPKGVTVVFVARFMRAITVTFYKTSGGG